MRSPEEWPFGALGVVQSSRWVRSDFSVWVVVVVVVVVMVDSRSPRFYLFCRPLPHFTLSSRGNFESAQMWWSRIGNLRLRPGDEKGHLRFVSKVRFRGWVGVRKELNSSQFIVLHRPFFFSEATDPPVIDGNSFPFIIFRSPFCFAFFLVERYTFGFFNDAFLNMAFLTSSNVCSMKKLNLDQRESRGPSNKQLKKDLESLSTQLDKEKEKLREKNRQRMTIRSQRQNPKRSWDVIASRSKPGYFFRVQRELEVPPTIYGGITIRMNSVSVKLIQEGVDYWKSRWAFPSSSFFRSFFV